MQHCKQDQVAAIFFHFSVNLSTFHERNINFFSEFSPSHIPPSFLSTTTTPRSSPENASCSSSAQKQRWIPIPEGIGIEHFRPTIHVSMHDMRLGTPAHQTAQRDLPQNQQNGNTQQEDIMGNFKYLIFPCIKKLCFICFNDNVVLCALI